MSSVALSIVVPVYNEEQVLAELSNRLLAAGKKAAKNFEIIFVNDASSDGTLAALQKLSSKNKNIHYISFSRNFGHQIAITAGMDHARGDAIVTIDGDLQDPPELIPDLYAKYQEGFKVVYAKRTKRKGETMFKLFTARFFYRLLARLVPFEIPVDVGDYRLISRDVVEYLKKMQESDKYIRGQIAWFGFKSTDVPYERDERKYGKTNYPFSRMVRLAFNGIMGFSDAPIRAVTKLGFLVCTVSFFVLLYALYSYFVLKSVVPGWASLIVSITFLGGVQLLSLGIIGEYISRIINTVRARPAYIVDETTIKEAKN